MLVAASHFARDQPHRRYSLRPVSCSLRLRDFKPLPEYFSVSWTECIDHCDSIGYPDPFLPAPFMSVLLMSQFEPRRSHLSVYLPAQGSVLVEVDCPAVCEHSYVPYVLHSGDYIVL